MNQIQYRPPVVHSGGGLPSRPMTLVVDEGTVTGDVLRTPHIFGGMSPLMEMASRIAAGIDPRSFLDHRYRNVEDLEGDERSKVIGAAMDEAAGFSAAYARRLLAACEAIDQLDRQHEQQQALAAEQQRQADEGAQQKNGRRRIVRP